MGARVRPYTPEVDDGYAAHAPVGSFAANAFGLCDVHGNVFEWCRDTSRAYGPESATDPLVEGPGGRVLRDGSWRDPAKSARSANRGWNGSGYRGSNVGVRPSATLGE